MKSIDERAKEKFPESVVRAHRCEVALRELAADLQAEKEKEVAELRECHGALRAAEKRLGVAEASLIQTELELTTANKCNALCELELNNLRSLKDENEAALARCIRELCEKMESGIAGPEETKRARQLLTHLSK